MSAKFRAFGVLTAFALFTPAAFAQVPTLSMTEFENEVYAAAEAYVSNPQWEARTMTPAQNSKKKNASKAIFSKWALTDLSTKKSGIKV